MRHEHAWFALRVSCCGYAIALSLGCGIEVYPHEMAQHESTNDFAPAGNVEARPTHINPSDAAPDDAGASTSLDAAQAMDAGRPERDAGQSTEPAADSSSAQPAGSQTRAEDKGDIELGGVPLRKQDVLAFIHFGHSNMTGFAQDPAELRPYHFTEIHPRVWEYHVGQPPEPALEPTAREDDYPTAGPGLALLKQAADRAPKKYFMSLGYGVSGAYCSQFLPGGVYFDSMTKSAIAIKGRVTFAGIIVMLGSTEIHGTDADRSGFSNCLKTVVSAVREAVGAPDLPMLMSGYEVGATGVYAVDGEFASKIIPEIAKVPSVVSNSAVVPADGLPMQDDHHFNLRGHITWTKRVLDTMLEKGWAPWMTDPTASSAP